MANNYVPVYLRIKPESFSLCSYSLSSLFAALIAICAAFKFAIMQRAREEAKKRKSKREGEREGVVSRVCKVNAAGKVNTNAKHKQS